MDAFVFYDETRGTDTYPPPAAPEPPPPAPKPPADDYDKNPPTFPRDDRRPGGGPARRMRCFIP